MIEKNSEKKNIYFGVYKIVASILTVIIMALIFKNNNIACSGLGCLGYALKIFNYIFYIFMIWCFYVAINLIYFWRNECKKKNKSSTTLTIVYLFVSILTPILSYFFLNLDINFAYYGAMLFFVVFLCITLYLFSQWIKIKKCSIFFNLLYVIISFALIVLIVIMIVIVMD